jgi:hypothetical protein
VDRVGVDAPVSTISATSAIVTLPTIATAGLKLRACARRPGAGFVGALRRQRPRAGARSMM